MDLLPKLQDMGYSDPLWKHFIEQNGKNAWDKALSFENEDPKIQMERQMDVEVCGKIEEIIKYLQLVAKAMHYVHLSLF